ncbi:hypothetical protein EBB79_10560 [Parasedimentitalea marina]|uniref:Uncharacterized protein n=2 Tax=Parasedimentitalea marina TaxID=2483033 RepID=A0A3T0N2N4_9RHOB|nr:hypothetical protein EBB79_10560 [Parasedimentitalea marina]
MGDSFAAAGGQFARALDLNHEKGLRETNIELENEKLRKEIDILANPSDPSYMQRYGGYSPCPLLVVIVLMQDLVFKLFLVLVLTIFLGQTGLLS